MAAIALGANLPSACGAPAATIEAAIDRLARLPLTALLARSSLFVTKPQGEGTLGQPEYVNACVVVRTLLTPRGLLAMMLAIEEEHGRVRGAGARNQARTLDLDLLLHGELVINEPDALPALVVPHPRMHERRFVLEPLAEVGRELSRWGVELRVPEAGGAGFTWRRPEEVLAMLARDERE